MHMRTPLPSLSFPSFPFPTHPVPSFPSFPLKASLALESFGRAGAYKLKKGGDYLYVPYTKEMTTMAALDALGDFKHFTKMLRAVDYIR